METDKKLTHLDENNQPGMVDVSHKKITTRKAVASGQVILGDTIMKSLQEKNFATKKGSITQTAIIAATMAVKNTCNTIPLCHQIPITSIKVLIDSRDSGFDITCTVKTNSQTGVEMEALNGVSVAALTIYDMCKAISHDIQISNIQLNEKSGGKNDFKK